MDNQTEVFAKIMVDYGVLSQFSLHLLRRRCSWKACSFLYATLQTPHFKFNLGVCTVVKWRWTEDLRLVDHPQAAHMKALTPFRNSSLMYTSSCLTSRSGPAKSGRTTGVSAPPPATINYSSSLWQYIFLFYLRSWACRHLPGIS